MSKFLTKILNDTPGATKASDEDTLTAEIPTGVTPVTPVTPANSPTRQTLRKPADKRVAPTRVTPVTPDTPDTPVTHDTPVTQDTPVTPVTPADERRYAVAPGSDFQKYPNANIRDGMPNGAFPGKSKKLYDVLWDRSRGAMKPTRKVIIGKQKLMQLSEIGSKFTLAKYLTHFERVGLLRITPRSNGIQGGNEYEVFIWGELQSGVTPVTPVTPGNDGYPGASGPRLPGSESAQGNPRPESMNIGTGATAKTLFKDSLNPDDERPLREALERFATTAKELTGREVTATDCAGLAQAINQMIDEAVSAAEKTTVISFGKFAAEHLRRRLLSKSKAINRPSRSDPGRPDPVLEDEAVEIVEYSPAPLSEDERKKALEIISEISENMGLEYTEQYYQPNYTPEDWAWLMDNREQGK